MNHKNWLRPLSLLLVLLVFGGLLLQGGPAFAEGVSEAPAIPVETVETETFSMDYFSFGEGDKTLVILPGLSVQSVMGSAEAVAQAYEPLTEAFTIYLLDRRKEVPDTYSAREMAEDTAEALRALGLEKVCLFGISQGGMIALDIAIRHPELVEGLVLGSAAASMPEERFAVIESWIALAKEGKAEELYLAFGEAVYPPAVFEQSRELLAAAAETVTAEELARFVILAESMRGFDVSQELEKIACPVLVLGSRDDGVLGAEASEEIAEKLGERPDFELYMYDGFGHAAYDLAPDYKERILIFLAPQAA